MTINVGKKINQAGEYPANPSGRLSSGVGRPRPTFAGWIKRIGWPVIWLFEVTSQRQDSHIARCEQENRSHICGFKRQGEYKQMMQYFTPCLILQPIKINYK